MKQQILEWLPWIQIDSNGGIVVISLLFIAVVIILSFGLLVKLLVKRLLVVANKTRTVWDDALIESFQGPLSLLVWSVGLSFASEILWEESQDLMTLTYNIRVLFIIFCISWFFIRFLNKVETNILLGNHENISFDKSGVRAVNKVLKISVMITATLVTLNSMGYSVTGVLAFGGVGGIAVGFAAKDLLANFFGGLMIYLDRPFKEGEVIRVPDKDIIGEVESIGWRLTRIRTYKKRLMYVPNSMFAEMAIENLSRMTHRRMQEVIGVRYDDAMKVPKIASEIEAMLAEMPAVDADLPIVVRLDCFNASSVDIFVNVYTRTTAWSDFCELKQDLMVRIYKIVEENNAEIAFPTTTVHLQKNQE